MFDYIHKTTRGAVVFCAEILCFTPLFLQDSGGFQMVSLVELSEVTEEGVKFKSPYDGKEILLTPEKSISIQNSLGPHRAE